jgi:excisionase family DNA binding protein
LTSTEVAELLGVSKWWVQEQVTAKAIPHHRVGRLVRFSPADIRAIEQRTAVVPTVTRLRSTA